MFPNFNFTFLEKGKTRLGVYVGNYFWNNPLYYHTKKFAHVCTLFSYSNFFRNMFNEGKSRYIQNVV